MELGTFTKHENGTITGTATTLLSSFELDFRPVEKVGNGPDFRVYRKDTEIEVGFAHHRFGEKSGKSYLNTLIDTPELSRAIWAALVKEADGSYVLKWNRPNPKKKTSATNGASQAGDASLF